MHRDQLCDPACGCGNFLIIAYRELRALELKIHERLQELN
ncbi:DNA methyltransferase [Dermabacter hominis]